MAYVSEPPVACSLTGSEQVVRASEARELMQGALIAREPIEGGVRLRFRGAFETRAAVRDLARREKECCPFFEFELAEAGEEIVMTVTAPADARPLLDSLFSDPEATPFTTP